MGNFSMDDCCGNNNHHHHHGPERVIAIPNTLDEAVQGDYFVGQTENMFAARGCNCWGGIVNPCNQGNQGNQGNPCNQNNQCNPCCPCNPGVDCFVDSLTVSCYTATPILAEVYLNGNLCCQGTVSCNVSPSNTAIRPTPCPKCQVKSKNNVGNNLGCCKNPIGELVAGCSTKTIDLGGTIIIPPGGSCVVVCKSPCCNCIKCRVACRWWEEEI
ncbi:MAG: DUF6143 family protein [Clostridiaceae bacterium]